MIKKNKWKLIISSLVILLPMVFGLVMWDQLPAQMTTHFGVSGAHGVSGRLFAVIGMPLILLAFQWLCLLISAKDIKGNPQNNKVFMLVIWIIPVLSLFSGAVIYATALGKAPDVMQYSFLLFGLLFTALGNYLPKCKQSFTTGIKIKWTLANEENWYATHRFAGKLWTVGGLVVMACTFLPLIAAIWVAFPVMLIVCVVPIVYSWRYYKKQVAAGTASAKAEVAMSANMKRARNITLLAVGVLLVGIAIFAFTADFEITYGETAITVDASAWDDVTVNYADIDSVEYRQSCISGVRTYGFGDIPVQMGIFQSEELGSYTRYAYAGCEAAVVITVDGKILVINGKDAAATQVIYQEILRRTEKE